MQRTSRPLRPHCRPRARCARTSCRSVRGRTGARGARPRWSHRTSRRGWDAGRSKAARPPTVAARRAGAPKVPRHPTAPPRWRRPPLRRGRMPATPLRGGARAMSRLGGPCGTETGDGTPRDLALGQGPADRVGPAGEKHQNRRAFLSRRPPRPALVAHRAARATRRRCPRRPCRGRTALHDRRPRRSPHRRRERRRPPPRCRERSSPSTSQPTSETITASGSSRASASSTRRQLEAVRHFGVVGEHVVDERVAAHQRFGAVGVRPDQGDGACAMRAEGKHPVVAEQNDRLFRQPARECAMFRRIEVDRGGWACRRSRRAGRVLPSAPAPARPRDRGAHHRASPVADEFG